jgi:hypothetical protein
MTRDAIKNLVLEIIKDIDEDADFEALQADQPLRKRHKLQIPEEDYPQLASLDSCVNYLEPLLKNA